MLSAFLLHGFGHHCPNHERILPKDFWDVKQKPYAEMHTSYVRNAWLGLCALSHTMHSVTESVVNIQRLCHVQFYHMQRFSTSVAEHSMDKLSIVADRQQLLNSNKTDSFGIVAATIGTDSVLL